MVASSWPSAEELDMVRKKVVKMSGSDFKDVRVVVSPYRICPLGAHIDHQGGTVLAMTINKGILLGFVPSGNAQVSKRSSRDSQICSWARAKVFLQSGQFQDNVKFRVDEYPTSIKPINENSSSLPKEIEWGRYAKGALYALQAKGNILTVGITGFICGSEGLDSSGLSSSAAVGVAYLLAMESANNLTVTPEENIELDRLIENGYLGLRNGILDQSAILLSKHGCLTSMNCKTKDHTYIYPPESRRIEYKVLLAFSGLKFPLANRGDYNCRVSECEKAAQVLLRASGYEKSETRLCDVDHSLYDAHKGELEPNLGRRAEHYFSENKRVEEGVVAWASGNLEKFGKLMSASGLSSIANYECGCEPMKRLYEILLSAPGVLGARFSGAGFRGCCVAFVEADRADVAASFVKHEYRKAHPELASTLKDDAAVLICEGGDSARVI